MTPEEAIEAAELVERETAYRLQLAREMYQAGWAAAEADMARRWAALVRPVVTGISHAEHEQRRWGPGGRAHFADPRPGDFPGRGAQPQPEPDTEMEAG
jgi:hypothetical protein